MNSGIHVSTDNSFSGSLGASQTYTGVAEDVRSFSEISINLFGTPSVAPGTLYFEFSPDGTNWDVSVPFTLAGPQSFVPLPVRVILPFFRVRYVNGATPLTVFRLTTILHWTSAKHLTRVINQTIDENEPVENVRAFIGGKSPDGPFVNQPAGGHVASQSSNTILGAGGVFNTSGPIISTAGYVAAAVAVKSDVNSANGGLTINFYADSLGTRLLKTTTFTYGSAPLGTSFQVPVISGPYMRVVYTNGATPQTTFELSTILATVAPPSDVLSISETINANTAAQIVKAAIVGQREDGAYANSRLSNSNSQHVAIVDRPSEVRMRVRVEIPFENQAPAVGAGTLLYTVTPGYRLYIHSVFITVINNSNVVGRFVIRDSTTYKFPTIVAEKAVGAAAGSVAPAPGFPEPVPISTNINLFSITGTIFCSGLIVGYEEPI